MTIVWFRLDNGYWRLQYEIHGQVVHYDLYAEYMCAECASIIMDRINPLY